MLTEIRYIGSTDASRYNYVILVYFAHANIIMCSFRL